jgi:predicted DNA-binding transcriptional regulator AlpA
VTEPRLLTGPAAAAYLSISHATFARWVAAGTVPAPIPNTRRWDRKALDLALDKTSGIVAPSIVPEEDEYAKWKQGYEARKNPVGAGNRK